jgi:hypothetical protein
MCSKNIYNHFVSSIRPMLVLSHPVQTGLEMYVDMYVS